MRATLALLGLLLTPIALAHAGAAPSLACVVTGEGVFDVTALAASETGPDLVLGNDALFRGTQVALVGAPAPFHAIDLAVDVGGLVGSGPLDHYRAQASWSYWSGDAWRSLNVAGADAPFLAQAGVARIALHPPADWAPRVLSEPECARAPAYIVRYVWDHPHLTPPLGSWIRVA